MRKIDLKTVVWKEGKCYVAQCLNVEVSSFGTTKKEAIDNLKEALDLYFEDESVPKLTRIERPDVVPLTLIHA
ncbi:MAG: type II toxin-antitoxin system HicB family antitoxin [Candidatus Uhrbacteria bacterium]